jgi:GT2 family glycosyltransferase
MKVQSATPWLSVLCPVYNGAAYLTATLESVRHQEDNDIECIVVDDGSTDASLEILATYEKLLHLTVVTGKRTGNWVANTNLALSMARGRYVSFLHQDDVWFADRLSTLAAVVEHYPDIILLLGSAQFIDEGGRTLGGWHCPLPALPRRAPQALVLSRLLVQNFVPIPAPIFTRQAALAVGGLDDAQWYTADWDFWLKMAARGPVAYYPRPLSGFRIHSKSQTVTRSAWPADFRLQHKSVARKYLAATGGDEALRRRIQRLSEFSIEVNTQLAAAVHGGRLWWPGLLAGFMRLGPFDAYRYLRDSRIWERASARVRARLRVEGSN